MPPRPSAGSRTRPVGATRQAVATLRRLSQHQVGLLASAFERLDVPSAVARIEPMALERRGGFLAIRAPKARDMAQRLRQRGIFVDARGDVLRMGPAPYLRDDQLTDAVAALGEVIRAR